MIVALIVFALGQDWSLETEGGSVVIQKKKVQSLWNPDFSTESTCHPAPQVIAYWDRDNVKFNFINHSLYESLMIVISQVYADEEKIMNPAFQENVIIIKPDQLVQNTLNFNCLEDGWSQVFVEIQLGEQNYKFQLLKECGEQRGIFDYSMIILIAASIITVFLSAISNQSGQLHPDLDESQSSLTNKHAVGFVVVASGGLILMYYLSQYLYYVLLVLISLASVSAITFTIMRFLLSHPKFNVILVISFILASAFVGIYIYTKNWIMNDVIAICYAFMFLHLIQLPNLKVSTILLIGAFFYDIFWVFISQYIFGSNVMVTVATSIDLPIKIQCPKINPSPVSYCGLIGLGDLVLPGLLICLTARMDFQQYSNYFKTAIISYSIALFCSFLGLVISGVAQPALLYISPILLSSIAIHAYLQGELKNIWLNPMKQSMINEQEMAFN